MSNDAYGRTPKGFWQTVLDRLDGVESRLSKSIFALPERLSPLGPVLTDANLALEFGHYRFNTATANSPISTGTGTLEVAPGGTTGLFLRQVAYRNYWDGSATVPGSGWDMRTWERISSDGGATWSAWMLVRDAPAAAPTWTDLSGYLINSFSASVGNVEGQLSNGEIELRGNMTAPALGASTSAIDFMSGIPTALRPTKRIGFGGGINGSSQYLFYARPDGTVAMTRTPAITAGATQFTIQYKAG